MLIEDIQEDTNIELDEVELIEDSAENNNQEPIQIIISNLLLANEVERIVSMCIDTEEKDTLFPLYILMENSKERVGLFDLTLENVIKLIFINKDYVIKLLNNVTGESAVIYSPVTDIVESLEKLVRLK